MVKALNSILMATNLKEYNKIAFDMAISMATHFEAKLVLLHVLEKMPEPVEDDLVGKRLVWLWGQEKREAERRAEVESARRTMLGKNLTSAIIQEALQSYCKRVGIDEASCGIPMREVVVAEGEVIDEILRCADEHDCGMIVMAAHEGLFGKTTISSTMKGVLKRSAVPVLTVPHLFVTT